MADLSMLLAPLQILLGTFQKERHYLSDNLVPMQNWMRCPSKVFTPYTSLFTDQQALIRRIAWL